jgi:C-terminal processing protease CtpA/Prc
MRTKQSIRLGLYCVAGSMFLAAAPLAAQSRSDSDSDRTRSQQTRDQQSERDRDQSQQRDQAQQRDQSQRDQSQQRDQQLRDTQGRDRERTQSRDQSTYRDQSDYRDQSRTRDESDRSEQDAGLGITLMETRDGVRIRQVLPGTPAERAGLRPGDYVLTVDEERIRAVRDVEQMIREKQPGSWVDLDVWRNGQRQTIEAQLASRQRAFSDQGQGQFGSRPGFPQQGPTGFGQQGLGSRPQQFQDGSQQSLAQQLQSLQRQLAQLQQQVDQLRSERQALRPTYDEQRQSGQDRLDGRSGQRQRDQSDFNDN